MPQFPPGQTLLIDADDTLWENNVYFERAIAAFISYLNHHEYSPAEVRQTLNAVERETILAHGYGLPSFTRSLVTCFERLSPEPMNDEKRQRVIGFARSIAEQEIELLPQVEETLRDLASRHRLILMTKGDHAEQADKVRRSGLASYFSAVEIVAEKDPAAYQTVIARHETRPAHQLDDRKQPQKRHKSSPRRWPPCRLSFPQRYVDSGTCDPCNCLGGSAPHRTRHLRKALIHLLAIPGSR